MSPRSPEPKALGQLLVMQGCIQLMDSQEQLFSMLTRACMQPRRLRVPIVRSMLRWIRSGQRLRMAFP